MRRSPTSRFIAIGTAVVTAGAMTVAFGPTSSAAPERHGPAARQSLGAAKIAVDVRAGAGNSGRATTAQRIATASARPATARLAASLGKEGVLQMDATTGTVRVAGRLDGYLTRPSSARPAAVAMGYVRAHLAALGLQRSDLSTLHLARDYRDIAGTHHLSWTQSAQGIPVFSNGLQAAGVPNRPTAPDRGAPASGLQVPASATTGRQKVTSAKAAIAAARTSLGENAAAGPSDVAARVLFVTAHGTYVGWQTVTMSASAPATTVVDSTTGRVLYRRSLSSDAVPRPTGPAAPRRQPASRTATTRKRGAAASPARSTSPTGAGCRPRPTCSPATTRTRTRT